MVNVSQRRAIGRYEPGGWGLMKWLKADALGGILLPGFISLIVAHGGADIAVASQLANGV